MRKPVQGKRFFLGKRGFSEENSLSLVPLFTKLTIGLFIVLSFGGLAFAVSILAPGMFGNNKTQQQIAIEKQTDKAVLAATSQKLFGKIKFNIPADFTDTATFEKATTFNGKATFNNDIQITNHNLDLGTGKLTASNVVYGVTAGAGISVAGGQTPVVTNTGVVSLQGQTGDVSFLAGTGITFDGLTVNNTGVTSVQGQTGAVNFTAGNGISISGTTISSSQSQGANAFGNITVGSNTVAAGSSNDTVTFSAGSGMTITPDTTNKTITFVANGGLSGLTTNGVLYATSNSTAISLTPGTSGFVLQSNGAGAPPSWVANSSSNPSFSAITSGTNTTAAMIVGSGASLDFTGTGTINVSTLLGSTWVSPGTIGATTPNTGAFTSLTGTTVNGLTITNNGSNTLTIASGKTLTVNNTISLAGTDSTSFTLPTASDTLVGRNSTDTLTNKTIAAGSNTITGLTNSNLSGSAGITNANLANSSVTVTAGTGLSGGGAVSLGSAITLNNAGVLSLTGTTNQVNVSSSTGNITLSLPQDIHTSASPTFAGLTLSNFSAGNNAVFYATSGTGALATTTTSSSNLCLVSGASAPTWTSCSGVGTNYWQRNVDGGSGVTVLAPLTLTDTLAIGITNPLDFSGFEVDQNSKGNATAVINQTGSGDIITASASGTPKFTINNNGNIAATGVISGLTGISSSGTITFSGFTSNGGPLYTNGSGVLAQVTAGSSTQVLHGGTTPSFSAVTLTTDVTGTLPVANGGTGTATTPTNGQLLIGNGTGYAVANLTGTTNQVNVTNGSGSITLSLPQDINIAASPTFAGLTLSNFTSGNNAVFYATNGTGALATTTTNSSNFCLVSGASTPTWTACSGLGTNYWTRTADAGSGLNVLSPATASDTLAVGITNPLDFSGLEVDQNAKGNAAAVINQTGSGDIFTASASGTSKFTIANNGNLIATGAISGLTALTSSGTITFSGFTSNGGPLYTNGSGVLAQTAAGSSTQVLHGGTTPSFSAVSLTADVTGILPLANGGTNATLTAANGGIVYSNASGLAISAVGNNGDCLLSSGPGTPTWGSCAGASGNLWTSANGAIYPINSTEDLFVGGIASSSAKFAVLNINNGTPTASVSAGTAGGAYVTADGTFATTAKQTLTIGSSSTGNIALNGFATGIIHSTSGILSSSAVALGGAEVSGTLGIGNGGTGTATTPTNGQLLIGNGTGYAVANITGTANQVTVTNGSGTISLSLPQNIDTGASPTFAGLTLSNFTASNNAVFYATNGTGALATASTSTSNLCLTSGASSPTWASCSASSGNLWTSTLGAIYPINSTEDLLIGGTASNSAKFAVLNVNNGTPTASVSAITAGAAYLSATGTLATTAKQSLTLGDANTGNVVLNGFATGIIHSTSGVLSSSAINLANSDVTGTLGAGNGGTGIASYAIGDLIYASGATTLSKLADVATGSCLVSGGVGVAPSWSSCSALGTNYWARNTDAGSGLNVLSPLTSTDTLAVGITNPLDFSGFEVDQNSKGNATAVVNQTGSGPIFTASASGTPKFTINNNGNIAATGIISGLTGLTSSGTITFSGFTSNGGPLYTNGSGVLAQTTAGSSTQVLHGGTTPSFSAVSLTADVTGILSLANGGTNASLTAVNGGVVYSNASQMQISAAGTSGQCLLSGGAGTPTWGDCTTGGGTNYWTSTLGALYPVNSTMDLLIGGTASNSAKFAVLNVNNGTPTASVSAGINGGAYLTAAGNLATTAMQTLTIGGSSTGNIILNPQNGSGSVGINKTPTKNFDVNGDAGITGGGNDILTVTSTFDTPFIRPLSLLDSNISTGNNIVYHIGRDFSNNNTGYFGFHYTGSGSTDNYITMGFWGNDNLYNFKSSGFVGYGTISPLGVLDLESNPKGNASLVVNNPNTTSALFTASSAGTTKFTINNNGNIAATGTLTGLTGLTSSGTITFSGFTSNGGPLYTNGSGVLAQTTPGSSTQLLHGGTTPSFSAVSLTADVTGILPLANGGTNASLTAVNGGVVYSNASALAVSLAGTSGQCLLSGGAGTPTWGSCTTGGGTNLWTTTLGAIYPINSTEDLLIGGTATSSAKFAFINNNTGTPTASISGNLAIAAPTGSNPSELFNIYNGGSLNFQTSVGGDAGLASKLYLANTGFFGIGTSSPIAALDIETNPKGNGALIINNPNTTTDILDASSSGTTKAVIDTNGNLFANYSQTDFSRSIGNLGRSPGADYGVWFGNTSSGEGILSKRNGTSNIFGLDLVTGFSARMSITGAGTIGIGTDTPLATLDTRAASGTLPVASLSGKTSFAGLVVDNSGTGDLFAASSSGLNRFVISQNGNVGIGTTAPTAKLDVEGGNIMIGQQTNTSQSSEQTWTRVSNAAGQIASGGTTNIASISASVVYNGSLYVGTYGTNVGTAEVYRYNGSGTSWTKVSQTTAGQIAVGGNTAIASVSAMAVYNGKLYIGTSKIGGAEVYRYDGGTTWTAISGATPGTMVGSSGQTAINGVTSMVVYGGQLIFGTSKPTKAELYKYDGTNLVKLVDPPAGNVCGPSTSEDTVSAMAVYNSGLFVAASAGGLSDLCRTTDASNSAAIVSPLGSFGTDNIGTVTVGKVTQMVSFNGRLYIAYRNYSSGGGLLYYDTTAWGDRNSFIGVNVPGTINGTTSIAGVGSIAVYNGTLYLGTEKSNGAEIYRYVGGNGTGATWTKVSQATAGTIASGGTSGINMVSDLIAYNGNLYAGTYEVNNTEIYTYNVVNDQSYALQFHAGAADAGGEQNSLLNVGSISFVASPSGYANGGIDGTGEFLFSHTIATNNGAYDVAEDYGTRDDSLEAGDVVAMDTHEQQLVKKADNSTNVVGIYSENPGFRLSQQDSTINGGRAVPIALAGRVPVKVSTENGPIHIGDLLTMSSQSGVAMKATKPGFMVARSFADYDNSDKTAIGKVMAFVNLTWADPGVQLASNGNLNIASNLPTDITTPITQTALTADTTNILATSSASTSAMMTDPMSQVGATVSLLQTQYASLSAQMNKLSKIDDLSDRIAALEKNAPLFSASSSGSVLGAATVSGQLSVTGKTLLSDVGITGKVTMGLLTIDGLNENDATPAASINTTSGPLKLQNLALNGIDILNGKITIDVDGNMKTAAEITAKKYNVNIDDVKSASLGEATISAGESKIEVPTTTVTKNSKIFVTAESLITQPLIVTEKKEGKSFTVQMASPSSIDVKFNWWIVN